MIVPNAAAACPYRVGDYLFSESATHPSTSWPGTSWVQVQGRTILGAGEDYPVGSEGGEAQHTLTEDELPDYTLPEVSLTGGIWNMAGQNAEFANGSCSGIVSRRDNVEGVGYGTGSASGEQDGFTIDASHSHSSGGGGQPHNNLPPYRAAYIWRRTA